MVISKKLINLRLLKKINETEKYKRELDEIFKKKSVGNISGTLVEQQQKYFALVKSGKIKSPVKKISNYY